MEAATPKKPKAIICPAQGMQCVKRCILYGSAIHFGLLRLIVVELTHMLHYSAPPCALMRHLVHRLIGLSSAQSRFFWILRTPAQVRVCRRHIVYAHRRAACTLCKSGYHCIWWMMMSVTFRCTYYLVAKGTSRLIANCTSYRIRNDISTAATADLIDNTNNAQALHCVGRTKLISAGGGVY